MPTKRIGGFLCYFVSYDCVEPPHIHLAKGKDRNAPSAKFWLDPLQDAHNRGLNASAWRQARAIVEKHRDLFLEM